MESDTHLTDEYLMYCITGHTWRTGLGCYGETNRSGSWSGFGRSDRVLTHSNNERLSVDELWGKGAGGGNAYEQR